MAAEEVLAFHSQTNQNEIIRLLSQDANLHPETKRGLQNLSININSWQTELRRLYAAIVIPRYTEQDVHELNLLHKARHERHKLIRDNMRAYWMAQNNPRAAALIPAMDEPLYTKHIILKTDYLVKGFDPMTGTYMHPLLWEGKVSVTDFLEDISICSFSQACNIPLSLSRILTTAQLRGFGTKQYISLLLDFIKNYIPTGYQTALVYAKDLGGLFDYVLGLVSSDSEVVKVRRALSNVRRKPGDSLNETVLKVKALTYMLYTMLSPTKEDSLLQKRASRAAMDSIFSLLSPPALEKYKTIKLKNNEMGHTMDLQEAISICNKIESVKGYELTTELLLPEKMSQSDLYVAEYDVNINQTGLRKPKQRQYDKYGPRDSSSERSPSSYRGPTRFSQDYRRMARKDQDYKRMSRKEHPGSYSRSPASSRGPIHTNSGPPRRRSGSTGSKHRGKYGHDVRPSRSPSRSAPSWTDKFKSPVRKGLCVRCGSPGHKGTECRRYPWEVPSTCGNCVHLFHQTDLCRFRKSRYVTPSRTPPNTSPVSYRRQVTKTQVQPEESQPPVSNPNVWAKNC